MELLQIGILGCGAAAERYYVPALKKYSHLIKDLYFVDTNSGLARNLADQVGMGKIYSDYRKIIDKVKGVIIILPNSLHFPVAMEFLNSGAHVLCEKPLSESVGEVKKLNAKAREMNVGLCVNNTRRLFPSFIKVKECIELGEIGRIKSIKFVEGNSFEWPTLSGFYVDPKVSSKGVLMDIGPHVLDLICWWLGDKPELVSYEDDSYGGPESVAKIKAISSNCGVKIFLNRLNNLDSCFEITGELGRIQGKLFEWKRINVKRNDGQNKIYRLKTKIKTYPEFVIPVVDNFFKVINGLEKPLICGDDVQNSIEMIEQCYLNRSRFNLPWHKTDQQIPRVKLKTIVTGATGFIGGSLVETLHLNGVRHPIASIRKWSSAARLGRFPVDIVMMDLLKKETIKKALGGVDEVIHCAKGSGEVNIEGTRNLLDACFQKGIKRFIHISTAEVYGDISGEVDEDAPFKYNGREYNQTKIDAEKICWEYYQKGLPLVVMRPSIVYGPFCNNWSVRIANMLLNRKLGIYEKYGEGKCNLVYIDDLVHAILAACTHDNAVGKAFNIVGPEIITWNQYFDKFNKEMGLPPLKKIGSKESSSKTVIMEPLRMLGAMVRDHFMVPAKKIANSIDFVEKIMKETEKTLKITPSQEDFQLFKKDAVFSGERLKELLNFFPSVSVDEGLQSTIMWLRHQGLIS